MAEAGRGAGNPYNTLLVKMEHPGPVGVLLFSGLKGGPAC